MGLSGGERRGVVGGCEEKIYGDGGEGRNGGHDEGTATENTSDIG